jgi:hypothetical protein
MRAAAQLLSRCASIEPLERRALLSSVTTTVQLEDAALSGAVAAHDNPGYTGTGYADYIANTGGSVGFMVNNLADRRDYHFVFRYANGSSAARALRLEVNGQLVNGALSFAPTGSWSRWGEVSVTMPLDRGPRTVRLVSTGSNGPNLDQVTYAPDDTVQTGFVRVVQAEDGTIGRGVHVARDNPGYTGSGYVDYDLNSGGIFTLNTGELPAEGGYVLEFRYANGSRTPRVLQLESTMGGVPAQRIDFAPTGSWSTWGTRHVEARMSPNGDAITLTSVGANGPNIDSMTVRQGSLIPPPVPEVVKVTEAETASRLTGAHIDHSSPGFTGTGYVDFDSTARGTVFIPLGAVPETGVYELLVRYANGSNTNRQLGASVDQRPVWSDKTFAPTGSWSNWRTESLYATLEETGDNVLVLNTWGANGPNIDSITVRRLASDTAYVREPEAEFAFSASAIQSYQVPTLNGARGGYAQIPDAEGGFLEWQVDSQTAQTRNVTFGFANGSASAVPMQLSVNGQVIGTVSFGPTGSSSTWSALTRAVSLSPGTNRVRLTTTGSGAPLLDYMDIA